MSARAIARVAVAVTLASIASIACGGSKARPNLPPPEYEEAETPSVGDGGASAPSKSLAPSASSDAGAAGH